MAPLPEFPDVKQFRPDLFVPTSVIRRLHAWPRYGLPSSTSALASGNSEQQKDYVLGIIIGSLIILGVAILWTLVLLILKCCGRRVGCASGRPHAPKPPLRQNTSREEGFEVTESTKIQFVEGEMEDADPSKLAFNVDEQYQSDLENYERNLKKHNRSMLLTRISFMLAGLTAIIASTLFFAKGAEELVQSLNTAQLSLDLADTTLNKAINVSDTFVAAQERVNEEKLIFADESSEFCDLSATDLPAAAEVQAAINDLATASKALTTGFIDSAVNLAEDLRAARELTHEVNTSLDRVKPFFYIAVAFSAVLDVIILSLMLSVALQWAGKKPRCCQCLMRCVRNVFIIPILFIFMFLAWLFCSVFVIAAVAGADFCMKPDVYVLSFLEKYEERFTSGSMVLSFLKYYVSACNENYEPIDIPEMVPEGLDAAVNAVHSFLEYGQNDNAFTEVLNSICSNSGDKINELASVLHQQLHVLVGAIVGIANVLQCSSMNPIYTTAIHKATCVNGVGGLAWLFWTQITIAVACMVMITLRAAWYGAATDKGEGKDSSEMEASGKDGEENVPDDLGLVEDGTLVAEGFNAEEAH